LGLLTVNALCAADEVLIPLQCEYFALEGLGQLLKNLRLVQQSINPSLRLNGIVLTMFDARTKLSEQVVEEVRAHFGPTVYETVVPRSVRLSEAPGFGLPIMAYDPGSTGAAAYRSLAAEFLQREPTIELMSVTSDEVSPVEAPSSPPSPRPPRPVRSPSPDPVLNLSQDRAPGGPRSAAMEEMEPPPPAEARSEPDPGLRSTPDGRMEARASVAAPEQVEAMTEKPTRRSWWPFGRAKGGNR
jgi:hypothetical protein